jgi:spore coat protein U-like protein
MSRSPILVALLFCCACVVAPRAANAAMNCRVTVAPLAFGNYLPGDSAPLDVTGAIDVSCRGQTGMFLATISTGSSGTYAAREMQSGFFTMLYNIYRNSARTLVWGDGTGGSVISGGTKLTNGRQDFSLPVYGRVPPQQSVGAGAYLDSVIVTIIF